MHTLLRAVAAGSCRALPILFAVFAQPALAPAQGSVALFGQSCLQGLSLSVSGQPRLGQTPQVVYQGIIGNHFYGSSSQLAVPFLMVGFSNTQAGGLPLPHLLPLSLTNGLANCQVYVSAEAVRTLPAGSPPPFGLPLPIPSDPGLVGVTLHLQWLTAVNRWSGIGPGQVLVASYVMTSNAATVVVGS